MSKENKIKIFSFAETHTQNLSRAFNLKSSGYFLLQKGNKRADETEKWSILV